MRKLKLKLLIWLLPHVKPLMQTSKKARYHFERFLDLYGLYPKTK